MAQKKRINVYIGSDRAQRNDTRMHAVPGQLQLSVRVPSQAVYDSPAPQMYKRLAAGGARKDMQHLEGNTASHPHAGDVPCLRL